MASTGLKNFNNGTLLFLDGSVLFETLQDAISCAVEDIQKNILLLAVSIGENLRFQIILRKEMETRHFRPKHRILPFFFFRQIYPCRNGNSIDLKRSG